MWAHDKYTGKTKDKNIMLRAWAEFSRVSRIGRKKNEQIIRSLSIRVGPLRYRPSPILPANYCLCVPCRAPTPAHSVLYNVQCISIYQFSQRLQNLYLFIYFFFHFFFVHRCEGPGYTPRITRTNCPPPWVHTGHSIFVPREQSPQSRCSPRDLSPQDRPVAMILKSKNQLARSFIFQPFFCSTYFSWIGKHAVGFCCKILACPTKKVSTVTHPLWLETKLITERKKKRLLVHWTLTFFCFHKMLIPTKNLPFCWDYY